MSTLADQIRKFVVRRFIKPRIQRGEKEIHVKAGDVAKEMGLVERMPAVCSALRSVKMRELVKKLCNVDVEIEEIKRKNVKRNSSTNIYIFRIIEKGTEKTKFQQTNWSYENEWFEETNIARKIKEWLEKKGWNIKKFNERKEQRGPDIEAEKDEKKIIIEVKGYPSERYVRGKRKGQKKPTPPRLQAKHWFADALLTAIKRKCEKPDSIIAIGLPKKDYYEELTKEVKGLLCKCLDLTFILVDENGEISIEGYHHF